MKTTDINLILENKQPEQLIGEIVIAIGHDPIGGYYLKDDELEIINVIGSMLKIINHTNKSNCLINVNRVKLKNPVKLKTYCISCNTTKMGHHLHNCATFIIDEMVEDNEKRGVS